MPFNADDSALPGTMLDDVAGYRIQLGYNCASLALGFTKLAGVLP